MHSRYLSDERQRVARLSGQKARRFRARWAACAKQAEETIRTIKLPLEVEGRNIDSAAFAELHATLREMRPGTLGWLLLTVHSLGFRIFSRSEEVRGFLNSNLLGNDEYRGALRTATGVAADNLDPVHLYLRFRMVPRPRRGTLVPFTTQTIYEEYVRYFSRAKPHQTDPALESLLSELAQRLVALGSWANVAAKPRQAFEAWDAVIRARGISVLPALGPRVQRFVCPGRATERATIAHDPLKPRLTLEADCALNLLVAVSLSQARTEGLVEIPELTQRVLQLILTDNYSGLSWLWGAGLRLLRDATCAQCGAWFGVDHETAAALTLAARSIPHDKVFGNDGFAAYRADVGGAMESWIRHYIDGLVRLDESLGTSPEPEELIGALRADRSQWLAMRAGTSAYELCTTIEEVRRSRSAAREALDRLLGKGPLPPSAADVKALEQYSQLAEGLHGLLFSLTARIEIESERAVARGDHEAVALLHSYRFKTPTWCVPPLKLRRMGNLPDPVAQSEAAAADLAALGNVMSVHAERISVWCNQSGVPMLPFDRIAQRHRRLLLEATSARNAGKDDALLLAVREVLDRFGRIARRQPDHIARYILTAYEDLEIFSRKEQLHRYFLSRQGVLHKHPLDRGVRPIIPIETGVLEKLDKLLPAISEALRVLRRDVLEKSSRWEDLSAVVELERAYYGIVLAGLPEILPSEVARPAAEPEFALPVMMERQLQAPFVNARVVRQLFNLYAGRLREISAILERKRFFVRHAFTRSRDNALVYVPKDLVWMPPERLRSTERPIGAAHKVLCGCEADVVFPPQVLDRAAQSLLVERGVRDWLAQSPHDWYYTGVRGGATVRGLRMSKAGTAKRPRAYRGAFRLIGPSSMKTLLDKALLHQRVTVGDLQVIYDRHFVQEVVRGEGGGIQVVVREVGGSLTLAVPVREGRERSSAPISLDRYLCVDLGEFGLGWTVFGAKTHEEVASGFESVVSLRTFAKRIRAGRRPRERETCLGSTFDGGMDNARERIAGEIVHTIDGLLSRFRAFPVLEVRARGPLHERGEIERIHRMVVETYAFVDKDSASRRRRAHWRGSMWTHPYLRRKDPESDRGKPLNLFPGTVVPASGNSQTCSRCGRNAIETVRKMLRGGLNPIFAVSARGEVELPVWRALGLRVDYKAVTLCGGPRCCDTLARTTKATHAIASGRGRGARRGIPCQRAGGERLPRRLGTKRRRCAAPRHDLRLRHHHSRCGSARNGWVVRAQ